MTMDLSSELTAKRKLSVYRVSEALTRITKIRRRWAIIFDLARGGQKVKIFTCFYILRLCSEVSICDFH